MPHVIARSDGPKKRIVIVGAGPAGLEAARVSALRGHKVTVFEATSRVGGQVAIAATVGRRKELVGITDWLYAEAQHAGVDFRFNAYAEAADIVAEKPDVVIIATGGTGTLSRHTIQTINRMGIESIHTFGNARRPISCIT